MTKIIKEKLEKVGEHSIQKFLEDKGCIVHLIENKTGGRGVPDGLRRLPFHCRVFPRARCLPGHSVPGHEHGAVAVRAHGAGGRTPVGLGCTAQATGMNLRAVD